MLSGVKNSLHIDPSLCRNHIPCKLPERDDPAGHHSLVNEVERLGGWLITVHIEKTKRDKLVGVLSEELGQGLATITLNDLVLPVAMPHHVVAFVQNEQAFQQLSVLGSAHHIRALAMK